MYPLKNLTVHKKAPPKYTLLTIFDNKAFQLIEFYTFWIIAMQSKHSHLIDK